MGALRQTGAGVSYSGLEIPRAQSLIGCVEFETIGGLAAGWRYLPWPCSSSSRSDTSILGEFTATPTRVSRSLPRSQYRRRPRRSIRPTTRMITARSVRSSIWLRRRFCRTRRNCRCRSLRTRSSILITSLWFSSRHSEPLFNRALRRSHDRSVVADPTPLRARARRTALRLNAATL
jgi:hypothetical protein